MEKLKPCPFCGGKARIKQDKTDGIQYRGMFSVFFHVECEQCGTKGKTCYAALPFVDEGENARPEARGMEEAVKLWNRRVEVTEETEAKTPAWVPMRAQNGELFGTVAFCQHCGMILSQFDIDGKKIGEKSCRNCGTKIEWEGYPHQFGMNMKKWKTPEGTSQEDDV